MPTGAKSDRQISSGSENGKQLHLGQDWSQPLLFGRAHERRFGMPELAKPCHLFLNFKGNLSGS